jgi:glyoxylase-like metal-dependent hydrolase (beta-lactamase superfamily II)
LNYSLYHEPDAKIEMDYFFWIIKNSERTIVVDTGFSKQGCDARNRTFLEEVPVLFAHFGVDPNDNPPVVLTHNHYDHAGNLSLFPGSQVIMADEEYAFWRSKNAQRAMFHHSIEDSENDHLAEIANQGRVTLFSGSHQLAPGIELLEVGGHTPGQSVVKVNTDEGVVLLASDAIHYYEEYEREMLFMSVANLVDMYEAFDTIHEMERSGEVQHVVSGHDPDTLNRFAAVDGKYGHLAATIGSFR